MLKVKNIQWDIDVEEIYEILDEKRYETVAEILGIPEKTYANMTTEERHDYIYSAVHHCPAKADEIIGLPDEIEIPKELTDIEEISDWLSDVYGYCHNGFELIEKA